MKNKFSLFIILAIAMVFASCERVEPNYFGVKMANYGKNGKSDYSIEQGKVWTATPGVELFQLPAWEQRADFGDKVLNLKSADNNEFTAAPIYSYKVIKDRSVDVVFNNARLGSGEDFMTSLEDNVLEPKLYDIIKEESRKINAEQIMAVGASLKFEESLQKLIAARFLEMGLELTMFSVNLDFGVNVKEKLESRNESNTNISVIDQKIIEQKKKNELAELEAQYNIIRSKGLTDQILKEKMIEAYKVAKQPIYGNTPFMKMLPN